MKSTFSGEDVVNSTFETETNRLSFPPLYFRFDSHETIARGAAEREKEREYLHRQISLRSRDSSHDNRGFVSPKRSARSKPLSNGCLRLRSNRDNRDSRRIPRPISRSIIARAERKEKEKGRGFFSIPPRLSLAPRTRPRRVAGPVPRGLSITYTFSALAGSQPATERSRLPFVTCTLFFPDAPAPIATGDSLV